MEIKSSVAEIATLCSDVQITGATSASLSGKPMTFVVGSSHVMIPSFVVTVKN